MVNEVNICGKRNKNLPGHINKFYLPTCKCNRELNLILEPKASKLDTHTEVCNLLMFVGNTSSNRQR